MSCYVGYNNKCLCELGLVELFGLLDKRFCLHKTSILKHEIYEHAYRHLVETLLAIWDEIIFSIGGVAAECSTGKPSLYGIHEPKPLAT